MRSCLVVLLFTTLLHGQGQYRFVYMDANEGLSNGSVHCIFQDSEGYIWIGTQDGLNRFDGYSYIVYRSHETDTLSLSDSFVLSITEDSLGNLWVGTRNGLNSLNKRTGLIRRIYESDAEKHLFQNAYTSLLTDRYGRIWCVHNGHILTYNRAADRLEKVTLPDSAVVIPLTDRQSNLLLYSPCGQVYQVDSALKVTPFDFLRIPKNAFPEAICACIDSQGILWAAAEHTMRLWDTNTGKPLKQTYTFPQTIMHLMEDSKGNMWVSTSDGLYRIQKTVCEHIANDESDPRSIPPGTVLCTYEDRSGNLWVGTGTVGFSILHPDHGKFTLLRSPIPNDAIWSVYQDSRNILWVGASSALFRYTLREPVIPSDWSREEKVLRREKITLMPRVNTHVLSLTEDHRGNIWAGTSGYGIFVMNGQGKILRHIQHTGNGLPDNTVFHLRTDSHGNIWASTKNGEGCYDPVERHWTLFGMKAEKKLCSNYVISSYADSKGNTWICSSGGLDVYNPGMEHTLSFLSTSDTSSFIRQTIITSCTEDYEHDMWIATLSRGIFRLKQSGEHVHYNVSNALESNIIYAIQSDRKGWIWASTSMGISVIDPWKNKVYNLSTDDGLPYSDYAMAGCWRNSSGELFWCATEGLLVFDPEDVDLEITVSKPIISTLEINYQPVADPDRLSQLTREDRVVKMDFVVVNVTHADKIIYQYRMKGFDDKWITANPGVRSATYTNLPYGQYLFEIRASADRFELPQAPVTSLVIGRHPPYWMSWWFLAGTFILFSVLATLVVKYFSQRKLKAQLREIGVRQKIHDERERISRELHDNVGSQLTYIISSIDNISYANSGDQTSPVKQHLESLGDFARATMQQLRETIWTLNKEAIPLSEIKNKIHAYTQRIVSGNERISLRYSFAEEYHLTISSMQAINIFRIMQEAVNNCIKHSDATELEIRLTESKENMIVVEIHDNGKGFQEGRGDEEEHYGMQNMQKRARELHGTLTFQSSPGKGTSVILNVPEEIR